MTNATIVITKHTPTKDEVLQKLRVDKARLGQTAGPYISGELIYALQKHGRAKVTMADCELVYEVKKD